MLRQCPRLVIGFTHCGSSAHHTSEEQRLLRQLGAPTKTLKLSMGKALGYIMRQLALDLGYEPVYYPNSIGLIHELMPAQSLCSQK